TLPHQTMQRESDYRWPSNSRIGKRDAFQFLGVGEENITLAGVLYPELTGGKLTMTTLRLMAEEGRAWPLLDGTGMIYGMYVISKVSETGSIFFADGTPRKIDFTLSKAPEAREGEYMAGEADNVFALTTVYATKAQAMRAAQAKWDKLQRGVAEFSISLATGRADIYTETPVRVSGFKRVIDEQDWTITKVTHFLNN
ncbi:phage tail protein, partial [Escherichia coli]|uniref:phage tail protein n=3 Tax=Escherichia coli TaxID=562 RepID=UPI0020165B8D